MKTFESKSTQTSKVFVCDDCELRYHYSYDFCPGCILTEFKPNYNLPVGPQFILWSMERFDCYWEKEDEEINEMYKKYGLQRPPSQDRVANREKFLKETIEISNTLAI